MYLIKFKEQNTSEKVHTVSNKLLWINFTINKNAITKHGIKI